MKKLSLLKVLVVSGALISILSGSVAADAVTTSQEKVLWARYFGDKAGTRVSPKDFTYDTGNGLGWGNNEQEYYTNKSENISMDGQGHLVITAKKLDPENPKDQYITNWCGDCKYSSAKIVTRDKIGFKYGTLSARIQVPEGVGMWPAFWMLGVPRATCDGWPACGEIDIMEARGSQPYHSVSTLHGPNYSGGSGLSHYYFAGNTPLTAGYHTYRVDWLQNNIKFYVDGNYVGGETKTSVAPDEWVFNAEFYLILNLATGGNFDGGALDDTIQQAQMKIDWIKYSTFKGKGQLIKH